MLSDILVPNLPDLAMIAYAESAEFAAESAVWATTAKIRHSSSFLAKPANFVLGGVVEICL
ncbi:MAG: hypothetical protein ABI690_35135 [Chloroflexota bacterium]